MGRFNKKPTRSGPRSVGSPIPASVIHVCPYNEYVRIYSSGEMVEIRTGLIGGVGGDIGEVEWDLNSRE